MDLPRPFFFVVSYWLAATPQKLVDRVGKILTPALVLTLGALIVKSVVDPLGVPQAAQPNYGRPHRHGCGHP